MTSWLTLRKIILCAFALTIIRAVGFGARRNVVPQFVGHRNTIVRAADRLVATQNNDGTWEWKNPDTNPATTNYPGENNVIGVTARGLVKAYDLTGNLVYLNAAKKAADLLVSKTPTGLRLYPDNATQHEVFSSDIIFLFEFANSYARAGNNASPYIAKANEYMDTILSQPNRFCASGCAGHADELVASNFNARRPNLFGWDIEGWVVAAIKIENYAFANDIVAAMAPYFSSLSDTATGTYGTGSFYPLGLSGYLQSYALIGHDFTAAKSLLLAEQNPDGSFKIYNPSWDGIKQSTAYAIIAFNAAGDSASVSNSVNYLESTQATNGAWIESDNAEYSEGNSENILAIFDQIHVPNAYYYATIQDAINAAGNGDTITVAAGNYVGSDIIVGKSLTLIGATGAKIVVPDSAQVNGIDINAGDVTITGFEIAGPVSSSYTTYGWESKISRGIRVMHDLTGFSITNNNIHDVRNGILIDGQNNTGSIMGNRIENTKSGISVQYTDGSGITISNNTQGPIGNEWGVNIHLNGCKDGLTQTSDKPPYVGGPAPASAQQTVSTISTANGGWSVQDQAYASSNRTQVQVATTGASGAQGSLLAPINTIQDGVNAVIAGGTVYIAAGTYALTGQVTINKSLILSGAGEASTTIDASANGTGYGILVSASNVNLNNFSLMAPVVGGSLGTSAGGGFAIHVSNAPDTVRYVTITHVTVKDGNRTGIDLNTVEHATVSQVTCQNAAFGNGIGCRDVSNSTFSGVTTSGNAWGGIRIQTYIGSINGIVISGANNFGESASAGAGGLYLEQGNRIAAGPPYSITYGLSGSPNVLLQSADFNYAVRGNDDESPQYSRIWFYKSLGDAQTAAALPSGAPGHITNARFIQSLVDNRWYVPGNLGSIRAAIDAAHSGDTIDVAAGTYDETIDINKRITLQGAGSGDGGTVVTRTVVTNPAPYPTQVEGVTYSYNPVVVISASGIPGSPILLKDLKIRPRQDIIGAARQVPGILLRPGDLAQGYVASYSYLELNNVRVIGTQSSGTPESGVRVDGNTSLYHYVVTNCEFNNMGYGMIFHNNYNAANPSTVQYVEINNTTFNNNSIKGFYTEKLSDATFTNVTVTNNGNTNLTPYYDWYLSNSGIDINLKYGVYSNLVFNNLTVTGNGLDLYDKIKPTDTNYGAGLTIKARNDNDSPDYSSHPASLTTITINGGTFSGNTTGLRFGEPGKNNTSPSNISVNNASISGNTQFGVLNALSGVTIAATGDWWGAGSGPRSATNTSGLGDTISASVAYSPWWNGNYIGVTHPWSWNANSDLLTAIGIVGHGDTLNYLGSYSGKLNISKNVVVNFATQPVLDSVVVTSGNLVLSSPIKISGDLNLTNGNIIASDTTTIVLDTSAANPVETSSGKIIGTVEALPRKVGTDSLRLLGLTIQSGKDDLGKVSIQRKSGNAAVVTVSDKPSIAMTWNIESDHQPEKGRDIVFSWLPDFDNNVDTTNVAVYRNDGSGWRLYAGPFTVSGVPRQIAVHTTGFSTWTLGIFVAPPAIVLDPKNIAFPSTMTGQWKDAVVTVQNTGSDTLRITSIAGTKSYFNPRPSSLTIPPGQTKNDTIRFTADSIGARNGAILIVSNAPSSPDTITLEGYGIGAPALTLNPRIIAFPSVMLGQWRDTIATMTNTGTDTLKISDVTSVRSYFSARPATVTIPPGQSRIDTIRFMPDSIGVRSTFILFAGNAIAADTIAVTGYGVGTPALALNTRNIAFPNAKIGGWKDTVLVVTNTGNDTLKITSIASTRSYFSVRPPSLTIPPGRTMNDTIRFVPDSIGVRTGLILMSSNTVIGADTINLSGYGTGTAVLQLSLSAISFRTVSVGGRKDTTITITNSGDDTLKISDIASTKGIFSARPTSFVIPPGRSRIDTVRFAPDSAGAREALILFTSNAVTSPDTLAVDGNGTTTGVISFGSEIPKEYVLYQNYPNPFNPSTTIRFGVPVRSHVRIDLYNILGQRIERLVDEDAGAGYFEKVWYARAASGFYLYRIEAQALDDPGRQFVSTKKLLLLK
jgi:hypothetical protein